MQLLYRRPLASFCLLFVLISFGAGYLPVAWSMFGMILFAVLALLWFLIGPLRRRCFAVGLCFCIGALSLCHSFCLTELPRLRAAEHMGEREVVCEVISLESIGASGTTAEVEVLWADGEGVGLRGRLSCDFPLSISVGDRIALTATLSEVEPTEGDWLSSRKDSDGIFLQVAGDHPETMQVQKRSAVPLTVLRTDLMGGIRILADRARTALKNTLYDRLGEEAGPLAVGFLIGDTSDMASDVIRDFRRSGIFHILSVSGLHLTVLLGAVEWFLRKLYLPKKLRILLLSLCGLALLVMTGFAVSACRAVLMLLVAYVQFMLLRDYDSVTSLFVSAFFIVLVSPFSVNDLGCWMSFQATLGLLTVFARFDEEKVIRKSRSKKKKDKIKGRAYRLLQSTGYGLLLTLIANLFLLPIFWAAFGEMSVVVFLANLLLSPLSSVFLVMIPVLLLAGWIPGVGWLLARVIRCLAWAIVESARFFSLLPDATVSLKYDFCKWIILPLTAVMILLLLIRVRKTRMLLVPPAVAAVAFAVCLVSYNLWFSSPEAVYLNGKNGTAEALAVENDRELVICDLSAGGFRSRDGVRALLSDSVATEVSGLILADPCQSHVSALESLSRELVIRRLYLPTPQTREEAELTDRLVDIAEAAGIAVTVYEDREWLILGDRVYCSVGRSEDGEAVWIQGRDSALWYLSGDALCSMSTSSAEEYMSEASAVVFGRDCEAFSGLTLPDGAKPEQMIDGAKNLDAWKLVSNFGGEWITPNPKKEWSFFRKTLEE